MKKFHFSLEALLEYRRQQENKAYKEFLETRLVFEKNLDILDNLIQEERILNEAIRQNEKQLPDLLQLECQFDYLQLLGQRIAKQKSRVNEAKKNMEKQRKELTFALQKRKIIENLYERKFSEWEYTLQEKERSFFDELAAIRFLKDKQLKF